MQGLWYGDKRDRVKWGALVHLAKEKNISCIIQVAYFRHGPYLKLQINECEVEREVALSQEVWDHFSDLRHIERLGDATGLNIIVLDEVFDPDKRTEYIDEIVLTINKIKSLKIVFLDPDTGIAPMKGKAEHITTNDLQEIWAALLNGDLLVIYQHAAFTENWLNDRKKKISAVCDNVCIKHILGKGIAQDMAMLWCCKGPTNEDAPKSPAADLIFHKTSKEGRLCACPCGKMTKGGYFYPGHDAKLKSLFLKVSRGKKSKKELDKIRLRMYEIWSNDNSKPLKDIAMEILG
jgi:hypothetical protein